MCFGLDLGDLGLLGAGLTCLWLMLNYLSYFDIFKCSCFKFVWLIRCQNFWIINYGSINYLKRLDYSPFLIQLICRLIIIILSKMRNFGFIPFWGYGLFRLVVIAWSVAERVLKVSQLHLRVYSDTCCRFLQLLKW